MRLILSLLLARGLAGQQKPVSTTFIHIGPAIDPTQNARGRSTGVKYADGLHRLGYNAMMIWPIPETIPDPPTPSDRAHLVLCPNVVPNTEAAKATEGARGGEIEHVLEQAGPHVTRVSTIHDAVTLLVSGVSIVAVLTGVASTQSDLPICREGCQHDAGRGSRAGSLRSQATRGTSC
jgi:hypothetical protein